MFGLNKAYTVTMYSLLLSLIGYELNSNRKSFTNDNSNKIAIVDIDIADDSKIVPVTPHDIIIKDINVLVIEDNDTDVMLVLDDSTLAQNYTIVNHSTATETLNITDKISYIIDNQLNITHNQSIINNEKTTERKRTHSKNHLIIPKMLCKSKTAAPCDSWSSTLLGRCMENASKAMLAMDLKREKVATYKDFIKINQMDRLWFDRNAMLHELKESLTSELTLTMVLAELALIIIVLLFICISNRNKEKNDSTHDEGTDEQSSSEKEIDEEDEKEEVKEESEKEIKDEEIKVNEEKHIIVDNNGGSKDGISCDIKERENSSIEEEKQELDELNKVKEFIDTTENYLIKERINVFKSHRVVPTLGIIEDNSVYRGLTMNEEVPEVRLKKRDMTEFVDDLNRILDFDLRKLAERDDGSDAEPEDGEVNFDFVTRVTECLPIGIGVNIILISYLYS